MSWMLHQLRQVSVSNKGFLSQMVPQEEGCSLDGKWGRGAQGGGGGVQGAGGGAASWWGWGGGTERSEWVGPAVADFAELRLPLQSS